MLPTFDSLGLLPPGDYELTFDELLRSLLVVGHGNADSTWDATWREALVSSGIRDPQGHELEFPSAFRQSRRDGRPRGIIKLKFGGLP
jgi:hypothetical protein